MKHNDIDIDTDIDIDEIIEDAQSNLAYNGVYRKREERTMYTRCALIIVIILCMAFIAIVCGKGTSIGG